MWQTILLKCIFAELSNWRVYTATMILIYQETSINNLCIAWEEMPSDMLLYHEAIRKQKPAETFYWSIITLIFAFGRWYPAIWPTFKYYSYEVNIVKLSEKINKSVFISNIWHPDTFERIFAKPILSKFLFPDFILIISKYNVIHILKGTSWHCHWIIDFM